MFLIRVGGATSLVLVQQGE
ncbi:hypothetical protein A2U01_0038580, partial [Trifolium medium]|nr:hypothetical protein [Trifolium medium]